VAVVATLSKGYDLDYIWTHMDRGPAKDPVSYYLQASDRAQRPLASARAGGLSVNMTEKSRPRSMQSRSSTAYFPRFRGYPGWITCL
jgi:hypothetical protein